MSHDHWAQAHVVARELNRAGLSAFPLRPLPLISIHSDDGYENYDYDVIGPLTRLKVVSVVKEAGYEERSGREQVWPGLARLRFPRPGGTLGLDPSLPVQEELAHSDRLLWVTPTQAILCLLHDTGGHHDLSLQQELLHLVWEQPANLSAVAQYARAAGLRKAQSLLPPLARSQAAGIALRRKNRFDSLLPR